MAFIPETSVLVAYSLACLVLFLTPGPDMSLHAAGKLMFLGTYFVIFTSPLALLLVLGAERLLGLLRRNPRVLRAVDWVFAGVFGAFAARILTASAR
jgi:threonine/homoserine/homoserine lactone efflux protein